MIPRLLPVLALLVILLSAARAESSTTGSLIAGVQSSDQPVPTSDEGSPTAEFIESVESLPAEQPAFLSPLALVMFLCSVALLVLLVARRLWRIPDGRGPDWPMASEHLLLGWIVFLLAGVVAPLAMMRLLGEGETGLRANALLMIASYTAQGIVILVICRKLARARRLRSGLPGILPRPESTIDSIMLGTLAFLFVFPVAQSAGMLVGLVQRLMTGTPPELVAHETLKALQESPGDPWVLVIMGLVVVAAPVTEEFAYRGLVQQGFRKLGGSRTGAVLLTSFLFVFMHLTALPEASRYSGMATLVVLSIVLGWLFERTGRLTAPITLHALFNLANLLLARFIA